MEVIKIEATDETPAVILDAANGIFEFSGRSLPEDAASFFDPILEWLDGYIASPNPESNFVFKLDYFNTASSKLILDIMLKLDEIQKDDNKPIISWYFKKEDEDMQEAGEEYADLVETELKLIEY